MPESLTRRESAYVNLGVSGFTSESRPASPRNGVRHHLGIASGFQVGIASGIASEYLAGISRNLHPNLTGGLTAIRKNSNQHPR